MRKVGLENFILTGHISKKRKGSWPPNYRVCVNGWQKYWQREKGCLRPRGRGSCGVPWLSTSWSDMIHRRYERRAVCPSHTACMVIFFSPSLAQVWKYWTPCADQTPSSGRIDLASKISWGTMTPWWIAHAACVCNVHMYICVVCE